MLIDRVRARQILQDAQNLYQDDIIGWENTDPKSYARILEEYVKGEIAFHVPKEDYELFCDILRLMQMIWQASPPQLVDFLQEIGLLDTVVEEEVIPDLDLPPHGTWRRYRHTKHGCDCKECKAAWAEYNRERRKKRCVVSS